MIVKNEVALKPLKVFALAPVCLVLSITSQAAETEAPSVAIDAEFVNKLTEVKDWVSDKGGELRLESIEITSLNSPSEPSCTIKFADDEMVVGTRQISASAESCKTAAHKAKQALDLSH